MKDEEKPSLELSAEKTLLSQMLGDVENNAQVSQFIPAEDLPESEPVEFFPAEPLPYPESYPYGSLSVTSTPPLTVKYEQTALSFSTGLDDIEDLTGKISSIEDNLKNVSSTMLNAFKAINEKDAKAPDADKFEERVTVNLNNLIYTDRISRTIDKPSWA